MDNRPLKIYSREINPRLRYIAGIILTDILGLAFEITNDKRKLGKYHVINYSMEKINGSLKIAPDTLLFEKGIKPREISVRQWKGLPIFFDSSEDSDLPFDIFAAAFFLVSRYEEYLDYVPDPFGRFSASSSLAFKNGFLQTAVVERWTRELAKVILKKFETLAFRRNEYTALITIDADNHLANEGFSLIRSLGGIIREFNKNENKGDERFRTVSEEEIDPDKAFDYITETVGSHTDVRFFFPAGDYSRYDKNPSWKNNDYRRLIQNISKKYKTGLHPSYFAADNLQFVVKELSRLKLILGKEIISARFHYLRLQLPVSYANLIEAGIQEDYSMGYPDEPGFRAGITRPFYFFDLAGDRQTSLRVIPFQLTDETLDTRSLDPAASKELIINLINETRKVGGMFVSIWHNNLLLDNQNCKVWREVFEFMVANQVP